MTRIDEAGSVPVVRPATVADIPAMMALAGHAVTAAHWSLGQYETIFSGEDTALARRALVVSEAAGVLGFLVAHVVDREWEIENIAVAGAAQRRGLGAQLLGEFLDLARAEGASAVFLEVRESNQAARALYERWAFAVSGKRARYYREPEEDALIYRLVFH